MKKLTFIILISGFCIPLKALKNIKHAKNEIFASCVSDESKCKFFTELFKKYDQIVIDFFDTTNNSSLAYHIDIMQKQFALLDNILSDKRFLSLNLIFKEIKLELTSLVTLLKQYIGSKNAVSLAFRARKFKKLLPPPLDRKNDFSLLYSMIHRLNC